MAHLVAIADITKRCLRHPAVVARFFTHFFTTAEWPMSALPMAWYDVRPLVVGLKSTRIAAQPSLPFSKKRLGSLGI